MQIASTLLLWELRRLGCTNEGNLQMKMSYWRERRCFMKLLREVLDLAGFSLCWSSCVLEVTMFLSSCFFPWLPGEEIGTSPSSLLCPSPFLYSLLVRFFFSWPRIWWRASVVRIKRHCHQRSKTGRLASIPSVKTQLDNQLSSCFCYLKLGRALSCHLHHHGENSVACTSIQGAK